MYDIKLYTCTWTSIWGVQPYTRAYYALSIEFILEYRLRDCPGGSDSRRGRTEPLARPSSVAGALVLTALSQSVPPRLAYVQSVLPA